MNKILCLASGEGGWSPVAKGLGLELPVNFYHFQDIRPVPGRAARLQADGLLSSGKAVGLKSTTCGRSLHRQSADT